MTGAVTVFGSTHYLVSRSVNQDSNFKIRAVRRDMISALEEARQKISLLALAVAARATWMGAERQ